VIRVLVVDDSVFVRNVITSMLAKDKDIEIVGIARNGLEALSQIEKLNPDVVTLDVEMPKMNGIETIQQIMKKFPLPVVMVSTLTAEGAEVTLKALEYGALDFILKDISRGNVENFTQELLTKVKAIARRKSYLKMRFLNQNYKGTTSAKSVIAHTPNLRLPPKGSVSIVAIGVSTGGPPAVQKILTALPEDFPACILIAQHMPSSFTGAFAARLDSLSKITVKEAETGDKLKAGVAYIAPGGAHLILNSRGAIKGLVVTPEPKAELYKPSVNVLFESIAKEFGKKTLAIVLTGMGSDGAKGAKSLKSNGAYVIAQNEQSCVVYGMPKAIVDAGLADQVVDINQVADIIMQIV